MGTNQRHRRQNIHQIIGVAVIAAAVIFGIRWWLNYVSLPPMVKVSFVSAAGKPISNFELEVAATPAQQARGLMFRKSLADNGGMIFLFPEEKIQSFWMKETY